MLAETCTLVSNYFRDSQLGLVSVVKNVLGVSTYAMPIFDSIRDRGLMKDDMEPDTVPAWCLWVDSSTEEPRQGGVVTRGIIVAGAMLASSDADPYTMSQLANVTMRGALIVMDRFNSLALSGDSFRQLNGVRILKRIKTTEELMIAPRGTREMWGFSAFTMLSVDTLSGVRQ